MQASRSSFEILKADLASLEREITRLKSSYAARLKQLLSDFKVTNDQLQRLVKIQEVKDFKKQQKLLVQKQILEEEKQRVKDMEYFKESVLLITRE